MCNPIEILPTLKSVGLGTDNEIYAYRLGSGPLRQFVLSRVFSLVAYVNPGPAVDTLRMSGTVAVTCDLDGVETIFTTSFHQDQSGNGTTAGLSFSRTFDTSTALCPTGYHRVAVNYEARTTVILSNGGGTFSTYPGRAEYLRLLKFMTWNIHHGVGLDENLNLQRITNTLLASGAHFAGFQDVDRHWSPRSECQDQPALLQQQTGWFMRYSASLDTHAQHCNALYRRQYGNLLLSRYPILSDSIGYLYQADDYERRSVLGAEVSIGGTRFTIFSSHLQHGAGSMPETIRAFQAHTLTAFINDYGGTGPKILMADLNDFENASSLSSVRNTMQDTWFAAGNPSAVRIDYIFTTHNLPVARAIKVLSNASDHDAVMSWVSLDPSSTL
ncbi:Metal-dependent hydrolase, endonuclease/exonuclease/phosphatase family [Myxococcus fulvus]|uniref:Metal-dependent hydrolase, endonuclease/exonuclease/phosphatase family n=1 Tax=Myxococcus fulvus TaxID=33 RepID=A0ABY1CE79_MYXFU|nr:Metal-dependent hydrolase, endonuclease/exonuclease/phosphatase family [Myxococcus fulvus]